jgi:hypothetical protein
MHLLDTHLIRAGLVITRCCFVHDDEAGASATLRRADNKTNTSGGSVVLGWESGVFLRRSTHAYARF